MSKLGQMIGGLVVGATLAAGAQATVLDFDTITGAANGPITSSYGGFNWDSNFYVESDSHYTSTYGNSYGSTSGEYAAFNAFGVMNVEMSGGSTFDFTGAQLTGWAKNDAEVWHTATTLTIEGYLGSTLVDTVTVNLSTNQYDWLQADFIGIDNLKFISSGSSKWWLMDDFTFNESNVPEPGTLALFSLGLAGIAAARKKRA